MLSSLAHLLHEPHTLLDAINVAKVITGCCIAILAATKPMGVRQAAYVGMHGSYVTWWMVEQALYPSLAERFAQPLDTAAAWVPILLIVGVFYALPAWNAFHCQRPVSMVTLTIAIAAYALAGQVNSTADVYMHATKEALRPRKVLVTTGIFRLARSPNYFADWVRYGSFCLMSGARGSTFGRRQMGGGLLCVLRKGPPLRCSSSWLPRPWPRSLVKFALARVHHPTQRAVGAGPTSAGWIWSALRREGSEAMAPADAQHLLPEPGAADVHQHRPRGALLGRDIPPRQIRQPPRCAARRRDQARLRKASTRARAQGRQHWVAAAVRRQETRAPAVAWVVQPLDRPQLTTSPRVSGEARHSWTAAEPIHVSPGGSLCMQADSSPEVTMTCTPP